MSVPRHAPRVPFALLVTGLIVGGMALLLALNTASAANELRRHDLAGRDAVIAAQVEELRIEVAASGAPANLAAAAAELGMVPAGNPAFLVIGRDGVVHLMGSPVAVAAAPVVLPKPAHRLKPRASRSTSATATKSAASSAHASKSASAPTSTSGKPKPSPTPTPTPTLTLPGGTR